MHKVTPKSFTAEWKATNSPPKLLIERVKGSWKKVVIEYYEIKLNQLVQHQYRDRYEEIMMPNNK